MIHASVICLFHEAMRRRTRRARHNWQVFGLTGAHDQSCTYWPSLPSHSLRCAPVPMTAVVPAYRCGTVPDSRRVPSCHAPNVSVRRSMPTPNRGFGKPAARSDYAVGGRIRWGARPHRWADVGLAVPDGGSVALERVPQQPLAGRHGHRRGVIGDVVRELQRGRQDLVRGPPPSVGCGNSAGRGGWTRGLPPVRRGRAGGPDAPASAAPYCRLGE